MKDLRNRKVEKISAIDEFERLASEIEKTQKIIRQLIVKTNGLAVVSLAETNNFELLNSDLQEIANQLWDLSIKCSKTSLTMGMFLRKIRPDNI